MFLNNKFWEMIEYDFYVYTSDVLTFAQP